MTSIRTVFRSAGLLHIFKALIESFSYHLSVKNIPAQTKLAVILHKSIIENLVVGEEGMIIIQALRLGFRASIFKIFRERGKSDSTKLQAADLYTLMATRNLRTKAQFLELLIRPQADLENVKRTYNFFLL